MILQHWFDYTGLYQARMEGTEHILGGQLIQYDILDKEIVNVVDRMMDIMLSHQLHSE